MQLLLYHPTLPVGHAKSVEMIWMQAIFCCCLQAPGRVVSCLAGKSALLIYSHTRPLGSSVVVGRVACAELAIQGRLHRPACQGCKSHISQLGEGRCQGSLLEPSKAYVPQMQLALCLSFRGSKSIFQDYLEDKIPRRFRRCLQLSVSYVWHGTRSASSAGFKSTFHGHFAGEVAIHHILYDTIFIHVEYS